jgi:hypothetical protein
MGCALGQGPLLSAALEPAQAFEHARTGYWTIVPKA